MEEKIPEIKHGHPIWWHHHGEKMIVSLKNSDRMIIKSNAAKIMIERARIRLPTQSELKDDWIVDWEIAQCRPYDEVYEG